MYKSLAIVEQVMNKAWTSTVQWTSFKEALNNSWTQMKPFRHLPRCPRPLPRRQSCLSRCQTLINQLSHGNHQKIRDGDSSHIFPTWQITLSETRMWRHRDCQSSQWQKLFVFPVKTRIYSTVTTAIMTIMKNLLTAAARKCGYPDFCYNIFHSFRVESST